MNVIIKENIVISKLDKKKAELTAIRKEIAGPHYTEEDGKQRPNSITPSDLKKKEAKIEAFFKKRIAGWVLLILAILICVFFMCYDSEDMREVAIKLSCAIATMIYPILRVVKLLSILEMEGK